jgi:predicted nucleotidyltransferase
VILYGSAAAGDHVGKRSDYNVLVVMDQLGVEELKRFLNPTEQWVKAGNPPPLLFTLEGLRQSADVFPIELADIKDSHRLLHGEDVISGIQLSEQNLRHQLEYELKSKVIQLRLRYLATAGKPKQILDVMMSTLSSFMVLLRAALRLYQKEVPATKLEAVRQLSARLKFDAGVFELIDGLKAGTRKAKEVDPDQLFNRYLATIESIVTAVDAYLCKS